MRAGKVTIEDLRVLMRRKVKLSPAWADIPKLLQLSDREDVALSQLEPIIDRNPGLSANVLRLANSAYMGAQQPIFSISHAIAVLGLRTVRSIALSALHHILSRQPKSVIGFDGRHFAKRSYALAIVCRKRCERLANILLAESGYEAGLFQELGYLVLLEECPDLLTVLLGAARQMPKTDIVQIEQEALGFTHAELGAALAEEWGFPAHIVTAIRYHHQPLLSPPEFAPLVDRAHYASWFCYQAGLAPFPQTGGHELSDLVLSRIQQSVEAGVELSPPCPEETQEVIEASNETASRLDEAA
jgi:HD-like signal output (HDOD) protein